MTIIDPYKDERKERLEDFRYGPRESPDYEEYIPEVYSLLDTLFDTPLGSPDALRLIRLIREKMWNVFQPQSTSPQRRYLPQEYDTHEHLHR